MPYEIPIEQAAADFPDYEILSALTPSEQKAAFRARDISTGAEVCLKIIAPDYEIDRLTREIRALCLLNHPNVVAFEQFTHSIRRDSQRKFIIERYVPGCDLAEKLGIDKIWPITDAIDFFNKMADGLSAIHAEDIVHRDLKPQNVRVTPEGEPVIIDLGLARHLTLPDATSTSVGARLGTPAYFAPEQINGRKHDIDRRTDYFALGVLMYYALTGEHPFMRPNITLTELYDSIENSDDYLRHEEFQNLPEDLKLLISRLLAKVKTRRPANAAIIKSLLESVKKGGEQ